MTATRTKTRTLKRIAAHRMLRPLSRAYRRSSSVSTENAPQPAFVRTRMSRGIIDAHRMIGQPSIARNVASNWLALGTAVVCTLVLTPVIVRSLQTERYGIWSFLNGLVAYSDLLYLGLGSALIKFVARARADRAHASVNRLAAVVLSIYTTLGVLCFGLLAAASRFVPSMFAETLPAATAHSASYVCVLLGV